MSTAKDVMTPDPIVLKASTTITEAVNLFLSKKISTVPVMSADNEVAGQLSELVLVRILVMHQLQPEKYDKLAHCLELLEPPAFADPSDSITAVLKLIRQTPTHRVLVRTNGSKILGIISPKDLLKLLLTDSFDAKAIQNAVQKPTT